MKYFLNKLNEIIQIDGLFLPRHAEENMEWSCNLLFQTKYQQKPTYANRSTIKRQFFVNLI